jgi:hypothetical protein
MALCGMRCDMEPAMVEDISLRTREIDEKKNRATKEVQEEEEALNEALHTESCPKGCYKVVSRFFLKSA